MSIGIRKRGASSLLGRKYGWKAQLPDARDREFRSVRLVGSFPQYKNLHSLVKIVFDQQDEGSCTANAINQAMMMCATIELRPLVELSRNFLYYNERVIEGDVSQDNGAVPRDGYTSAASLGVAPESLWPYRESDLFEQPSAAAFTAALAHKIGQYLAIPQGLTQMKQCLSAGYPFTFGISVYESFESVGVAKSGNVPMPNVETEAILGGHYVVAIGYNDSGQQTFQDGRIWPAGTFLCQNSWGMQWGMVSMAGCFSIPYEYLTNPNLSSDFWTIRSV